MNLIKHFVFPFYNSFLKIELSCDEENILTLNTCSFEKTLLSNLTCVWWFHHWFERQLCAENVVELVEIYPWLCLLKSNQVLTKQEFFRAWVVHKTWLKIRTLWKLFNLHRTKNTLRREKIRWFCFYRPGQRRPPSPPPSSYPPGKLQYLESPPKRSTKRSARYIFLTKYST